MNGKQFISSARKYACKHALPFEVQKRRGKGGHVMIKVGNRKTVVKSGEIGKGLFNAMLNQLGIKKEDFQ